MSDDVLQLTAETLDGEIIEFAISDIQTSFPDDGVTYIAGSLGPIPVATQSIKPVGVCG